MRKGYNDGQHLSHKRDGLVVDTSNPHEAQTGWRHAVQHYLCVGPRSRPKCLREGDILRFCVVIVEVAARIDGAPFDRRLETSHGRAHRISPAERDLATVCVCLHVLKADCECAYVRCDRGITGIGRSEERNFVGVSEPFCICWARLKTSNSAIFFSAALSRAETAPSSVRSSSIPL
jgi:hypothetical protein